MAQVLTSLLLLVLAQLGCAGALTTTGRKPNVVFILVDDLGFHDVSYHDSRIQTPTLDELSEDGVRLENYYVQPICSPTRCQLMTGRYQIHQGTQHSVFFADQAIGLPLDEVTLPEKLREVGYSTHMVGKWHLGFFKRDYLPTNRGFDTFFGLYGGHQDHYTHKRQYKRKGKFLDLRDNEKVANVSNIHSTELITQRAVDLIERHDADKPLFLYLAYQAPHSPLQVPKSYRDLYKDIRDKQRRAYAGMVTHLDEGVANVTQALKDNGLWNDTILIFSTDNGGSIRYGASNHPLRGAKYSLWEGGIRGVGFVTGGSHIAMRRKAVSRQLTHVSDWFPTILGEAGASLNGTLPLDGFDQWESISSGAPGPRKWVLHNIDTATRKKGRKKYPDTFDTRVRAAIRVGDYKLITGYPGRGSWVTPPEEEKAKGKAKTKKPKQKNRHPCKGLKGKAKSKCKANSRTGNKEKPENVWLFNIAEDPEERINLAEQNKDLVKEILDTLQEMNKNSKRPFYPRPDSRADPSLLGGVWGPWL